MNLAQLLAARGIDPRSPDTRLVPFLCEEDGEPCQVWRIASPAGSWVLKRAKAYELGVYTRFLSGLDRGVPRCFGAARQGEADYLLLEDVSGTSLRRASRPGLERALEALIFLQARFRENTSLAGAGYSFPLSLKDRQGRGRWLILYSMSIANGSWWAASRARRTPPAAGSIPKRRWPWPAGWRRGFMSGMTDPTVGKERSLR